MDIPRQHVPRQDATSAIRAIRRTIRYTVALVCTLALGIGANIAMFWIVDQLLS
jgi:uncharacterized membrane protein